ncbi:TfoX/Sxy family protein [Feifania hominis]|uniref:TfoX/Sxy family protein n=1 Tax=Feifania hominis TaxID=2763660 RepID=A0A926HUM5_9FIRM|nr:TfoX/Sxy family protein [Feifania hominis]MBC8535716.1 TfoX/Sxy family protein [Feifania hominis]
MCEMSSLPNIGPQVARQLREAGITTAGELRAAGSRQAWLRIRAMDPSACIHRLYALEGAVRGVKKSELPPDVKAELKAFYNAEKEK